MIEYTPLTDAEKTLFDLKGYIHVRHHKPNFKAEMLDALTPAHRRFFNEVYHPKFDRPEWANRV